MEMNVDADPDEFFARRSENDPSYPFMLVLCGSAFLMIKVGMLFLHDLSVYNVYGGSVVWW